MAEYYDESAPLATIGPVLGMLQGGISTTYAFLDSGSQFYRSSR